MSEDSHGLEIDAIPREIGVGSVRPLLRPFPPPPPRPACGWQRPGPAKEWPDSQQTHADSLEARTPGRRGSNPSERRLVLSLALPRAAGPHSRFPPWGATGGGGHAPRRGEGERVSLRQSAASSALSAKGTS
eukprot:scaffold2178_cov323-Prasinococcus_capsulatus_cf.AAC.5